MEFLFTCSPDSFIHFVINAIVIRCNGVWQELVELHNDAAHDELVKIFLDIGVEYLRSEQTVWPYLLHNGERT